MGKVKVTLLVIMVIALGFAAKEWWYSDQGYKYIEQRGYDNSVRQDYKATKKVNNKEEKIINFYKIGNEETVAWIEIPNTPVDYPILSHKDNEYYLKHNLDGEYSVSGSIFLDYNFYTTNIKENNPFYYNDNHVLTVFGHNMGSWTDVMFTSLKSYLKKDYYSKHKTVNIYVPDENYKSHKQDFSIKAVRVIKADDSIYQLKNFNSSEEEKTWYEKQINSSVYTCDNTQFIENSDYLILSTCANDGRELDRIILICRREK